MSKVLKLANGMLDEEMMSLQEITIQYICNNLDIISYDESTVDLKRVLYKNIILPSVICDHLLESYQQYQRTTGDRIINIFRDNTQTSLKVARLRNSFITNYG